MDYEKVEQFIAALNEEAQFLKKVAEEVPSVQELEAQTAANNLLLEKQASTDKVILDNQHVLNFAKYFLRDK